MATIRTAIMVQDNMSRAFQSMSNAMNIVISSFESMERASSNAIDTASLQAARRELNQAEIAFGEVDREIKDAIESQQRFNDRVRDGTGAMGGLVGKVGALIGAYLSIQGLKNVLGMADEVANTTARLAIMNDGLQSTAELNDKIMASANRTYSSFADTADMVSKLGVLARDAFANNDEIIAFSELLNKHFVISGTSIQGQQAAMLQLTQAMASGALRGQELNSIFEQAPTLVQNIADHLGVSTGQIKEMAAKGQITADVVKRAMFAMADETNERFQSMPNTFADIWNRITNEISSIFGDFFAKLTSISDSEKFKEVFLEIISALNVVASVAESAVDILVRGANYIYDNWSWIEPIIIGVAVATGVYTLALGLQAAATWLANGAAKAFFTTLLTNPLFWIALAIGVVIAVIYKWVQSVGGIKIAWMIASNVILNAWDSVKIGFMEGVYRVLNLWDKLRLGLKIGSVGIQNIMGDMKSNILTVLQNMVNEAIDIINEFISVLKTVPGVTIDLVQNVTFGTAAQIENETKKQARIAEIYDFQSEIDERIKERDAAIEKMRNDAANEMEKREAKIKAAQKAAEENQKMKNEQPAEFENNYSGLGDLDKNSKETAKNTAKMAKSMDGTVDELKYLRDLAEREAINRFVTAEIKVDMTNNNNINSELDIDGIVDRFGEKVEEVAEMIAEGAVYDV
ncbi:hypothetical protein A0U40_13240 [[Bacillus] sp. KCTC 13219]|nr:hypothetical protein A0U40_13240 [[Bacillus] sp. KCTC 13219]